MILFRPPFSEDYFTVKENSNVPSVEFISFDEAEKVHFNGDIQKVSEDEILENPILTELLDYGNLDELRNDSEVDYTEKLENVIDFIKENNLAKLVISRRKLLQYHHISDNANLSLSQSFLQLCKTYPNAFAYLFLKNEQCWMGAFSELLGSYNKQSGEFTTMSLAGTLPVNETWTKKEIVEQQPVTDYVQKILQNYSVEVLQSDTYDHISGNIKHLRTDFSAQIKPDDLEKIISELHPTPAVCGIPKDFCKKAITEFENYPRELYAGYIKIETNTEIQYFVNLRCAQFLRNAAFLYVGGGITGESDAKKEWTETELKSEAILKNLVTA